MTDSTTAFTKLVPGFDFLQGLVKNAGSALPNIGQWVAPTLDPEELAKRIEELRTVQFWLEQNARMLGATIQALEVQRMTLSTLKTMNVQMSDLRDSMKLTVPEAAAPAPARTAAKAGARKPAAAKAAAPAGVVEAAKRKSLEELLKRARAGEDFAKLAGEFSEDTVSRSRGGEYQFPRGKMVPEFEAAAFSMKTNEISNIVTSKYGYHIIKLNEKIPAYKIKYADAAAEIKKTLAQHAIEERFPDYIARLRQEAGVEILDEKLKPQDPVSESFSLPAK